MSCDTCRSGTSGENTYTAFHVDGRLWAFCRDCDRRVGDPYVWCGGERHGRPVLFADEPYTADDFAAGA